VHPDLQVRTDLFYAPRIVMTHIHSRFGFDEFYVGESLESPASICDPKQADVA